MAFLSADDYVAIFRGKPDNHEARLVYWQEDDEGQVVGFILHPDRFSETGGQLRSAESFRDFLGYARRVYGEHLSKPLGVLPAPGWRVRYTDGGSGPLVGWLVDENGYGCALTANEEGEVGTDQVGLIASVWHDDWGPLPDAEDAPTSEEPTP